jgi:hypothetical protein
MQTALRLTARVQAGHRLEIVAPELTEGEEVTILVTPTAQTALDLLWPTPPEESTALARHLLASGAIPAIPSGRTGQPPHPITVQGKPVSETIIEERG